MKSQEPNAELFLNYRKTLEAQFLDLSGKPTSNVLETISSNQAIYSFPATPTGIPQGLPGRGQP